MNSPVLLRLLVLMAVVSTAGCRSSSVPIVDVTPIGDALRFLAVAIVLGAIINSIFDIWGKD